MESLKNVNEHDGKVSSPKLQLFNKRVILITNILRNLIGTSKNNFPSRERERESNKTFNSNWLQANSTLTLNSLGWAA